MHLTPTLLATLALLISGSQVRRTRQPWTMPQQRGPSVQDHGRWVHLLLASLHPARLPTPLRTQCMDQDTIVWTDQQCSHIGLTELLPPSLRRPTPPGAADTRQRTRPGLLYCSPAHPPAHPQPRPRECRAPPCAAAPQSFCVGGRAAGRRAQWGGTGEKACQICRGSLPITSLPPYLLCRDPWKAAAPYERLLGGDCEIWTPYAAYQGELPTASEVAELAGLIVAGAPRCT